MWQHGVAAVAVGKFCSKPRYEIAQLWKVNRPTIHPTLILAARYVHANCVSQSATSKMCEYNFVKKNKKREKRV